MGGQKEEVCFESLLWWRRNQNHKNLECSCDLMRSERLSGASLNAKLCAVCKSEYPEVFLTCILREIRVIVMRSNIIVLVKILAKLSPSSKLGDNVN